METRYCIEYVNPRHPLRDDGSINIRYDRVLTLEQAEHDLTLILSFGAKILDLYMGNVVDGEIGEWNPKPMIIDEDAWFTIGWLQSLKQRVGWKPTEGQMKALHDLNLTGNISYVGQGQTLIDLYKDLKKLNEERK